MKTLKHTVSKSPIDMDAFHVVEEHSVPTLISIFKEELLKDKNRLKQAYLSCDTPQIHYYIHKMFGSSRIFGAYRLSFSLRKLEFFLNNNLTIRIQDFDEIEKNILEIDSYISTYSLN